MRLTDIGLEKRMNIPLNEWNGSKDVKETLERIQKDNAAAQRWTLYLTFVAAVGAVIAAVPVVQTWLTKIH
jgi:hypothetical protein